MRRYFNRLLAQNSTKPFRYFLAERRNVDAADSTFIFLRDMSHKTPTLFVKSARYLTAGCHETSSENFCS